ncbi:general negative regulator of transcription subunit 5 [Elasticomyces elasticus]|uniref:C2H2-type domain-containing protein n=1 Tax=Exophiala sideris TaxID=1016849 RepID=A0ABR0J272_9EURO|nr:general negative regulator of transcription subunit 5 [Elasticomyces elasticus]KAK5024630.1 hypothetical protein LTS07_008476 [Exophiala sideris]KAK5030723.1 general negative regulator of transcription subunit 5 [Exophiala sideris]KAK5054263.1 hypothetical protein LTR69_008878 [Exophiala sideris]KAK5179665.1 hypothetical protein LTR44_007833 [Eurotiomycetes sp. CCFEE 6388]
MSGITREAGEAALSISSATHRCYVSFQRCLDVPWLMEREWAENRLADFMLWASGIGAAAAASDKISLDARLASRPALINIFSRLLQMLMSFLEQCQEFSTLESTRREEQPDQSADKFGVFEFNLNRSHHRHGQQRRSRSLSPWSDQSSFHSESEILPECEKSVLVEAMSSVDSTLLQLNNLSVAVRRTGNQLRLEKADSRFDRSEHSSLEAFLRVWISAHTNSDPLKAIKEPDQLSPIQERLIEVNLRRRNRFLYAQRHSNKMDIKRAALRTQEHTALALRVAGSVLPNYHHAASEVFPGRLKPPQAQATLPDQTLNVLGETSTATRLEATTEILKEKILPQDTQVTSTAAQVRYPDPPKLDPHVQFFKCPCCCQTLSRALSRGNLWRKHLVENICPYTCIRSECPQPEATWLTRQAWIDHMNAEEHYIERCWKCLICADAVPYANRAELLTHTNEMHTEVASDHISTLLDASLLPMSKSDVSCPLCRPNTNVSSEEASYDLDHIAEHIHTFALLSLPWAPDVPAIEEETWLESCQKVVHWLKLNDQSIASFQDHSPIHRATVDEASLYFEKEKYFAETAAMYSHTDGLASESEVRDQFLEATRSSSHVVGSATNEEEARAPASDSDRFYEEEDSDDWEIEEDSDAELFHRVNSRANLISRPSLLTQALKQPQTGTVTGLKHAYPQPEIQRTLVPSSNAEPMAASPEEEDGMMIQSSGRRPLDIPRPNVSRGGTSDSGLDESDISKKKELGELCGFLSYQVKEINRILLEELEPEAATLQNILETEQGDRSKADRLEEIRRVIDIYRWHKSRLQLFKRALKTGFVTNEAARSTTSMIQKVVRDGKEPNFDAEAYEGIYDDCELNSEDEEFLKQAPFREAFIQRRLLLHYVFHTGSASDEARDAKKYLDTFQRVLGKLCGLARTQWQRTGSNMQDNIKQLLVDAKEAIENVAEPNNRYEHDVEKFGTVTIYRRMIWTVRNIDAVRRGKPQLETSRLQITRMVGELESQQDIYRRTDDVLPKMGTSVGGSRLQPRRLPKEASPDDRLLDIAREPSPTVFSYNR